MKFFLSSQCSAQTRIGPAVEELADLGITHIELTGGTRWYLGLLEELHSLRTSRSLQLLVHNYFPPQESEFVLNLAVRDPARQRHMTRFVREALVLTRSLGNQVFGVHPGFRQDVGVELENGFFRAGDPGATSEDAFYSVLDELDAIAASEGVLIAVENLAPRSSQDRFSFLSTPGDILRFLDYLNHRPHLGLLVDFGHLGAASTLFGFSATGLLDEIFATPAKILEIHLSENSGGRDTHGVTPLDSWQVEYLSKHASRLGDIPVVFEWQNAATEASARRFHQLCTALQPSDRSTL